VPPPDHDSTPALCFERVSYAYSGSDVVREVTLSIHAGAMVGLLGSNGAGKSTLLRLASGVLRPREGRVQVAGREVGQLTPRAVAQAVAVVPQEFSVPFAYTVRQLVELGRTPYLGVLGVARRADDAAVEEALRDTDLLPLADRVFNQLSGGERQRVLVALALAQSSRLLLLDEPTAHLDIRHQVEVMDLLTRLNRERGLTIFAALHDLNLAARYFPRLVLLRRSVLADGPPSAVLDRGLLAHAYRANVSVGILRGERHLSILPEPHVAANVASTERAAGEPTVYVLAGGGAGELAMRTLADAGITFSVAPLAAGDSDEALARQLAVAWASAPPYAPIPDAAVAAARTHLLRAHCALVCPAPYSSGNLSLLLAVREATENGLPVLLWEPGAGADDAPSILARVAARDDAEGSAVALYRALLDLGVAVVATPAELMRALARLGLGNDPAGSTPASPLPAEGSRAD
jgi:iron complex transport system ATP-binding protein